MQIRLTDKKNSERVLIMKRLCFTEKKCLIFNKNTQQVKINFYIYK